MNDSELVKVVDVVQEPDWKFPLKFVKNTGEAHGEFAF